MNSFNKGYALVVGVANYKKVRPLPATVLKDAQDISQLLIDPVYCGYPAEHVRCLLDGQATVAALRSGLQWLADQTSKDDTAVLFFSGHGGRIDEGGNYLMPVDADPQDLENTALSSSEFTRLLQKIEAGRLLVLFDCCHAGGIGHTKDAFATALPEVKFCLNESVYERLTEGEGRAIIASSRSNEVSLLFSDMQNSLFTHYLLKALRGEANTYGDGLIRILDVFQFTAQQVAKHDPRQHPVIKANLESNFPIALYLGGPNKVVGQETSKYARAKIEIPPHIDFPNEGKTILSTMFLTSERVVVKDEFGGGFSRGRVFVVRPVKNGAELPAVVKMGPAEMIKKEEQAFQKLIRNRVPYVAPIEGEPVFSGTWGGIRYPLVGHGEFTIESLGDYCNDASGEDIEYLLKNRLFRSLKHLWLHQQTKPQFNLHRSYDPLLPVNLVIEYVEQPPVRGALQLLSPKTITHKYQAGDYVWLSGFRVTKKRANSMSLNLPSPEAEDGLPASYVIRLESVQNIAEYPENKVIVGPIIGKIKKTRQMLLEEEVEKILGDSINLESSTISLSDGTELPNPLLTWASILNKSLDVRVASIHGDLNMRNVIVESDHRTLNMYLIDFANARLDHVLHDFLRLETEVLLHLVAKILSEAKQPAERVVELYEQLHKALVEQNSPSAPSALERPFTMLLVIRQQGQTYLFDSNNWSEYYNALTLYLLGALKFSNLDHKPTAPLPKQIVFWGACATLKLLNAPHTGHQVITKKRATTKPQAEEKKTQMPDSPKMRVMRKLAEAKRNCASFTYHDIYTKYEIGVCCLLECMGQDHDRYAEAEDLQQQLEENIRRSRGFLDTPARRSERAELISQLNRLTKAVLGISFRDLHK